MNKTFLFDLDDTLIENQTKYSLCQAEFLTFAIKRLGHKVADAKTILNMQVDIDHALVKTQGFSSERFPMSFRETYRQLCEKLGTEDKPGEDLAYAIGQGVFDEPRWVAGGSGLIKGAKETLDFLVSQNDELRLVTLGDLAIQNRKIEVYGLKRWFGERVYITSKKDRSFFESVVADRSKQSIWVIGNSIRSDVLPALEADLKVIYVPCETWDYDRVHNGVPKSDKLITLDKLQNLISIYPDLK